MPNAMHAAGALLVMHASALVEQTGNSSLWLGPLQVRLFRLQEHWLLDLAQWGLILYSSFDRFCGQRLWWWLLGTRLWRLKKLDGIGPWGLLQVGSFGERLQSFLARPQIRALAHGQLDLLDGHRRGRGRQKARLLHDARLRGQRVFARKEVARWPRDLGLRSGYNSR